MGQQEKWNARYQHSLHPNQPAAVLADNIHLLPPRGRALDLACGLGGNALLLARADLIVDAWDISEVALGKLQQFATAENLPLQTQQIDIESGICFKPLYDVVVVSRFLHRPLFQALAGALKPGGLLFCQTFCKDGPDNEGPGPQYRLNRGELLSLFVGLLPVYYRDEASLGNTSTGLRNEAAFIGQKPEA